MKAWNKVDSILLFFLLASVVTLICTSVLVWDPYLQTSSFYWSDCGVSTINYMGLQYCKGQNDDQCYTPTITLPPDLKNASASRPVFTTRKSTTGSTNPLTNQNQGTTTATVTSSIASSQQPTSLVSTPSSSSSSSSSANASIGSVRKKRDTGEECVMFPCVRVNIVSKNPYTGLLVAGEMWNQYSDMVNYPQCSISSCEGNDEDNYNNVEDFVSTMVSYLDHFDTFYCYVNYYNYSQIIYHPNESYPAAINSIIWPIIALIAFFFAFVAYRFRGGIRRSNRPGRGTPPPGYDATFGVANPGYPSTGQVSFVDLQLGAGAVEYVAGQATGLAVGVAQEKDMASLGAEVNGRGAAMPQIGPLDINQPDSNSPVRY